MYTLNERTRAFHYSLEFIKVVIGEAEKFSLLVAPGLTLTLCCEKIRIDVNLVFNDGEKTMFVDEATHV